MNGTLARALLALGLMTLGTAHAYGAEATTGTITGTVTANGAAVADAHISAASPSGTYTATTNARGRFALLGVRPDTYVVSVQAAGYEPAAQNGIVVLPNQNQPVSFQLLSHIKTIANVQANTRAFPAGGTSDVFTVHSRGVSVPPVSASGLAAYSAGTVQGAIAAVPGVSFDQFANAVLRG